MIPRLKEQFNTELKQKIMSDLQLSNVNEIPSLEKIIINIGDGKAATDGRALESMVDELTAISGQKPVCLLYTSPSPRDATLSRMPSSA